MAQKTVYDKNFRHVKKKIRVTVNGFRPSALYGRVKGPKVLLNSIPKAGTNLLENALIRLPMLRNAGQKTITAPDIITPDIIKTVANISRGQFLNGHLPYYKELEESLRENNIRVIFIIRDPRDVVVSWFKYVCNIDCVHSANEYISSLDDDDARLMAAINGVPKVVEPINQVLNKYAKWLESDICLTCKFEDLVGENGGGSTIKQHKLVRNISDFLGLYLPEDELKTIAGQIYSTKSSTFNKGNIGSWHDVFKDEHIKIFKKNAGEDIIKYGYESRTNW